MNGATTQLTQPQRKALVEMISKYGSDVWDRARDKYEATRTSHKEAIIREVAGERAIKLKDDIVALRTKAETAEEELRDLGLEVNSDETLDVVSHSSDLSKTIEKRLDAEVGMRKQVLDQTFERARVKLLLAVTTEEAEQIVEPLLNFEVQVK